MKNKIMLVCSIFIIFMLFSHPNKVSAQYITRSETTTSSYTTSSYMQQSNSKYFRVPFYNKPQSSLQSRIWYSQGGYSGYLYLGDWEWGPNGMCNGFYEGTLRQGPYVINKIELVEYK